MKYSVGDIIQASWGRIFLIIQADSVDRYVLQYINDEGEIAIRILTEFDLNTMCSQAYNYIWYPVKR